MKFPLFLAKRFVAGNNLDDALEVVKAYKKKNILVTLDHLGEDVVDKKKARKATKTYIKILESIKNQKLQANISIKLSQVGLAINKKFALENTRRILKKAKQLRLFVEIDMEGSRYTDDTLSIVHTLIKTYQNTLVAIQAYLYRSKHDVYKLIKQKGKIRLVKGGYKEPETIAFKRKEDTDKHYVMLMQTYLLRGAYIAIATHDDKIIDKAKNFIVQHNISKKRYEFELLYGIRPTLQEELTSEGHTVRVYVPYGTEWFPYYFRRLRERKENLIFMLKHLFKK